MQPDTESILLLAGSALLCLLSNPALDRQDQTATRLVTGAASYYKNDDHQLVTSCATYSFSVALIQRVQHK